LTDYSIIIGVKKVRLMAGYSGFSRSNNCEDALQNEDLLTGSDFVKIVNKRFDVKLTVKEIEDICSYSEWHHTGKYFNRQYFYDRDYEFSQSEIDRILALNEAKKAHLSDVKRKAKYLTWEGTRNHPKAIEHVEEGTVKGNWFYLEDGSKKSINSNGFKFLDEVKL
jgi:hypothetical protein